MQPRLEFRVSALEKRTATLEASAEEQSSENKGLFDHVQKGFDQAHAFVQEQFAEIKAEIAQLKTTQAEQGQKLDQILALLQQKSNQ
jgi:hypothetical protein